MAYARVGRSAAVGVVGALVALLIAGAVGAQTLDDYPDLVADPPEEVQPPAEITWQGEEMLVVKFDGFVTNIGGGPLHIEGNPQPSASGSPGAVAQHILDGSGTSRLELPLATGGPAPAIEFENSDGHEHWHLMRIMEYSLWDETKTRQVTAGEKIGFCLFDTEWIGTGPPTPGVYAGGGNWCAAQGWDGGGPDATYLQMGVSSGWRDTYNRFISLQWVDVSHTAPGHYYLAALADPNDLVAEADETNNTHTWTDTLTVVPGYLAQDSGPVAVGGAQEIALPVSSFGSGLGVTTYVIDSSPAHGVLDVQAGIPFTGGSVTYTPVGGYDGTDSFTFYAHDAGSPYPRDPAAFAATVTVEVATPNAPPSLGPLVDQQGVLGADVALHLAGTDPDVGDVLTYASQGLPAGLEIDPATGLVTGTLSSIGDWTVTVTVSDGALTAQADFTWTVAEPPVFTDVGVDHRFAEAIGWMAKQGISFGCGDGTEFCPDEFVTRGQIASFLVRAFGLTTGAGDDLFSDDDGSVHEASIDILATASITLGCAEGRFCPTEEITRGQFASLLVRATGMSGGEGGDRFTDDDGNTHELNIDILAFNGVTDGCTATAYCPDASLTRGQLAQLLYSAIGP